MKKAVVLSLALFLFAPSLVFSNTLTFKLGLFFPAFKSDLWETEFENMNFKKSDYYSSNFGFALDYFVTRQLSLVLSIDFYSKNKLGYYKDYVGYTRETLDTRDDFAFPTDYEGEFVPSHSFNVSITPIQLSLKLLPLGRGGKLIPYIGGGVGFYLWSIRLYGDSIDFSPDPPWYYNDATGELHQTDNPDPAVDVSIYPINPGYDDISYDYTDIRQKTKVSIGYHGFAGIMYPIANRTTIELEFKYNVVKGKFQEKDPTQGFHGFEPFDLGGYQISIGINYWF
jgi:opacity protein-like surface antigen